jgi:hypothetical protein
MINGPLTLPEYLCQHPELSGFVNLYSNSPIFDVLLTLSDTIIFIPNNDALYNAGDALNNYIPTQIDENFLYGLVPVSTSSVQCTYLPGYSVTLTPTSVNGIPYITITNLAKGNVAITLGTYLVPTTVDPNCLPQY